ncbi:MAG TPA: hypothetical protein VGX76_16845 [Pirellulales bacterium]|jgi:hypothetical protein|nr:hypothetical protein [Pirellulales bacterium]
MRTASSPGSWQTPRLLSMIGMLVVLAMLISVAGRPSTWRWLAPGGPDEAAVGELRHGEAPQAKAPPGKTMPAEAVPDESLVAGPNDLDPQEMDQAKYEFQVVSDKEPLAAEEMPSYWRLLRWSRSQSFADLKARAQRDVRYSQLFEEPGKYRGRLVYVPLHVRQVFEYDAPANRQGLKVVYEARGPSDESHTFPYVVVFDRLPPGMPLGSNVHEEATFVGYFLKTYSYTDGMGKLRAAPLLFGRLKWHGVAPLTVAAEESGAYWQTIAAGAAVLLLIVGVWIWRFASRRRTPRAAPIEGKTTDVEAWLRAVESIETEEEQACRRNS